MQCTEVRAALKSAGEAGLHNQPVLLRAHLADCADCRTLAEDMQFRGLLGDLPVPGPGAGYADRALAQAWAVHSSRTASAAVKTGWGLATAAVLVLAVSIGLRVNAPATAPADVASAAAEPVPVVVVAPSEVREVNLLMVSAAALADATISLQLDANVVLAGYPGRNRLSWQTALAAGNNQLTLPVQLTGTQSGTIIVAVESGGARKQMMFTVQATDQQALALLTI